MATSTPNQQRILIVEDEDNARKGYEALLRKWNWEILGVGSGEEALAKFQEFQPSLILADVELPGMNGLDLLKQLGDDILRIPVIIITGRGSDERVVQAIEAGAYWYIEKPLKPPVLRALLNAPSATCAISKPSSRSPATFAPRENSARSSALPRRCKT